VLSSFQTDNQFLNMKIYLDTCIISGIAKKDLPVNEQIALVELLKRNKEGIIQFTTSSLSEEEISQIPEQHRPSHSIVYDLLREIKLSNYSYSDSGLMMMGMGGGAREDAVFTELKTLLPDEPDAKHVFQAIKGSANVFLTVDSKTILKHKDILEKTYPIKMLLPSELLEI